METVRISAHSEEPVRLESFSTQLWGLDWTKHFPVRSSNGSVECRRVPFASIEQFFLSGSEYDYQQKKIFYGALSDSFGFYAIDEGMKLIGAAIANPSDPTTYYLRFAHILPEYRARSPHIEWLRRVSATVSDNPHVQRIEVEISPEDSSMPVIYARLGFRITGTAFSDRWGGIIRMTAHLRPEVREGFLNRFCPFTAPKAPTTQGGAP